MKLLIVFTSLIVADALAENIGSPYQEAAMREPPPRQQGSGGLRCLDVQPPEGGQIGSSAMADINDDELIARLIYAETLAARCPAFNEKIAPKIAEVIFKRIQDIKAAGFKDPVRRVIFGRSMFGSSLFDSKRAKWKEFVCPSNGLNQGLFEQSQTLVQNLKNATIKSSATHYFLHLYTGSYQNHKWGPKAKLISNVPAEGGQMCLGVYQETKSYLNTKIVN